jgi:hypothetical protein
VDVEQSYCKPAGGCRSQWPVWLIRYDGCFAMPLRRMTDAKKAYAPQRVSLIWYCLLLLGTAYSW